MRQQGQTTTTFDCHCKELVMRQQGQTTTTFDCHCKELVRGEIFKIV
jgi:hypothetical protein